MIQSSFRRLLPSVFLMFGLVACRESGPSRDCAAARVWSDSVGTAAERERIELQWARVEGRWDSLMATREGKAKQDRAAGSLNGIARRYHDSLASSGEGVEFRSGCVDWSATWAASDFDRLALATAMARVALADSGWTAIALEADTTARPTWVRVDLLKGAEAGQTAPRTLRLRLDSLVAKVDSSSP